MASAVLLGALATAYARAAARLSPCDGLYWCLGAMAVVVIAVHTETHAVLLAAGYGAVLLTLHRGRAAKTVVRAVAIGLVATALAAATPDLALRAALSSGLPTMPLAHGFALVAALLAAGLGPLDARDPSLTSFAAVGAVALPAELFAVAVPWAALGVLVFIGGRGVARTAV